jgi:hypothetical protein
MAMVANSPAAAKRVGVPQSVGKEFMKADKGKRFGSGSRADAQVINRPKTNQGKQEFFSKGGDTMASKMNAGFMAMMAKKKGAPAKKMANGGITTAKMGAVRTAAPSKDGLAAKGKTKGMQVKMGASKPLGMKYGGKTC